MYEALVLRSLNERTNNDDQLVVLDHLLEHYVRMLDIEKEKEYSKLKTPKPARLDS